ncbi:MAG TPA: elongation factor P maturation arginine rhamnosyltransferase EarP [Usitatibacter sp.]|nr:elongation factor P maturation arginine rhamnosyltransferase EarP [Usitatibacter sp.]
MQSTQTAERWDVFCRVVDNFGDVGVSWRLARQVAREHGKRVRLWLDDLTVLAKLRPEIDAARDLQSLDQVEVARLREPFAVGEVADVVVETFGCDPPEAYVHAMAAHQRKPRWINLEYLSAEDWVAGSHALPSPNPRLPLVKHYFFPGFTPRTGGLLRERSLIARRDEFQADAGAQAAFWRSLVGKVPPPSALKVSLFAYAGAPLDALARSCMHYPGPVWLLASEGVAASALRSLVTPAHDTIRRNEHSGGRRRELEVFEIPFLAQDRYDQLLWASDVNFVRGEDSFVRAQWAGRPFAWNIYPTEDGAHWVKMAAFLALYTQALDRAPAAAVTALWEAWNRVGVDESSGKVPPSLRDAWAGFVARREALEAHSRAWSAGLAARRDLAAELVDFADNVIK